MKKAFYTLLASAALPCAAHAQSDVTLYGLMDTSLRYSTHEDASGRGKSYVSEGVLTGSRWGLRGTEALGAGMKAEFVLESGFSPDTGISQQSGRLFGRQAFVGLSGNFGKVTLGRQFTLPQDVIGSYEPTYLGNLVLLGYQGTTYTGLRQDNMVKYVGEFGGTQVMGSYTFGETPGSLKTGSSYATALGQTMGPFKVAGVFQIQNDVANYFGSTVVPGRQTTWSVGGTYTSGATTFYLGYTNSDLVVADYKNQALYTGAKVAFGPSWSLLTTFTIDKLKHADQDGRRVSTGAVLGYALSKRTDVYVAADYTWLKDAWMTVAQTPGFFTPFYAGYNTRIGTMAGVRHRF